MSINPHPTSHISGPSSFVLRLSSFVSRLTSFVLLPSFFLLLLLLPSCQKPGQPDVIYPKPGTLTIRFEHTVSGNAVTPDTMLYSTSLGYHYMVNDLQYFISDVALTCHDGNRIFITDNDSIHYIDLSIPGTWSWDITQSPLRTGSYDSISFVFGLSGKKNRSNRFANPPERDMFWPDILGGGYHYMKLNLKYKSDTMAMMMPFMFHLGIGQIYSGNSTSTDSITGFVQNYFTVHLPLSGVILEEGKMKTLTLRMNIEKWFDGQNAFDFSKYSMGIMQNEEGMSLAVQNGREAFTIQ